tara:strand:- start:408 stop:818 length:411 start_codon:yes stop_codon:yes gene_type:complete
MAYTQSQNPFSRKSSSPFKMKGADGKRHGQMSKEEKAAHKAAKHPSKKDPEAADEMRYEDNTQAANQPMGPERRSSSSPLNAHDEVQKEINAARAAYIKRNGSESGFYEEHADLFEKQEKARLAHKEEKPKEEKTQ